MRNLAKPRLPLAYQEVEYIQSDGNQRIKTEITTIVGKTYKQDADIQFMGMPNSGTFSLNGGDFGLYWGIFNQSNTSYFCHTSGEQLSPNILADTNRHHFVSTIDTTKVNNTLFIDSVAYTSTRTNAYGAVELYIFNYGISVYSAKERVFNYKIYEDDILLRHYIPCYRKSDGVIGLYDLCGSICPLTGTPFYINSGTGAFTKGNDIVYGVQRYNLVKMENGVLTKWQLAKSILDFIPSRYVPVEYIESHGTEYIDTGLKLNSLTTEIEASFYCDLSQGTQAFFGARNTSQSQNMSSLYVKSGNVDILVVDNRTDSNNTYRAYINDASSGVYDFVLSKDKRAIYKDGILLNSNTSIQVIPFPTLGNCYICKINTSEVISGLFGKVYKFKIFDNSILVRNFIPCKDSQNNDEAGLYDVVNGVFYTNQGTGTFGVGNEI